MEILKSKSILLYARLLIIILMAVFFLHSIIAYDSNNNSFNTSSNIQSTGNILRILSAYSSDLLVQFFGISSFLLVFLIFGYQIKKLFYSESLFFSFLNLVYIFSIVICVSLIVSKLNFNILIKYHFGGIFGNIRSKNNVIVVVMLISIFGLIGWRRIVLQIFSLFCYLYNRLFYKVKDTDNSELVCESKDDSKKNLFQRIKENNLEIKHSKIVCEPSSKSRSSSFIFPSVALLTKPCQSTQKRVENSEVVVLLEKVLRDFGVQGKIVNVRYGPVVTLYELNPSAGTKSSRVIGLADDIARSMSALSTRIAVIPGRNAIGIELPNQDREIVMLRDLLETNEYKNSQLKLPIALGKGIDGDPIIADLAKMPHLLVAGTTGSGKSVAINTMILSLIYRLTPEECKMIMIDPKMLELSIYDSIPHLLTPVVTEPKKAVAALKWVVREMENRYRSMSVLGVRNITGYNEKVSEAISKGVLLEKNVQTGFDKATGEPIFERITVEMNVLPYIVVIVDEMADLMLVAGKEIESSIQRLAQMARAAGIHIIMATQRPSVDVITGVIKANFPTRISFAVTSKIDSRTILGEQGAEQLLGMGDMLYMVSGGKIIRVHAPFVSDNEVQEIVKYLKSQGIIPSYLEDVVKEEDEESGEITNDCYSESKDEELYNKAVEIVLRDRKASTSYIQRHLRIGYNRAANLIERMEKDRIVGSPNHLGRREIICE